MPREVEEKAMKLVMDYERSKGREPRDVSRLGCGYDIESGGRLIEVKGMSHPKGDFIMLYKKLFTKLGKNLRRYYIYVVYDIKNSPRLKIIEPETILGNIEIETAFLLRAKSYKDIKETPLAKTG